MVSAALPLLLESEAEPEVLLAAAPEVAGMPGAQPEPAEWPRPGDRPWAVLSLQEVPWLQAGLQQAAECGDFPGVFQPAVEPVSRSEVEFQASLPVHKVCGTWPSEVWGPVWISLFRDEPAVVCTEASPAHIAACSRSDARGRLDQALSTLPIIGMEPLRSPKQHQKGCPKIVQAAVDVPNYTDKTRENMPLPVIKCVS